MTTRLSVFMLTYFTYASLALNNQWIRRDAPGKYHEENRLLDLTSLLLAINPAIGGQVFEQWQVLARHRPAAMQQWPWSPKEEEETKPTSGRLGQRKTAAATPVRRRPGQRASAKEETTPAKKPAPFRLFGSKPEPEPEPAPPPAKKGFSFPSFGAKPEPEPEPAPPPAKKGFSFPSFGAKPEPEPEPTPPPPPKSKGFTFPSFGTQAKPTPSPSPEPAPAKKPAFTFPSFGGAGGSATSELTKTSSSFGSDAKEEAEDNQGLVLTDDEQESSTSSSTSGVDLAQTGTLLGAGVAGATIGGVLIDAAGLGLTGELATDAAALGAVAIGGATVYAATRPDEFGEAARFVGDSVADTTGAYAELAAVNAELAILEQQQKAQAVVDETVDQLKAIPGKIAAAPGKVASSAKAQIKAKLESVQNTAKEQVDAARREIDQLRK